MSYIATSGGGAASVIPSSSYCIIDGDSIPAGVGLSSPTTQNWFAQALLLKPFVNGTYYNFAVSASQVADLQARYTASIHPLRPAANGGHAAFLFVHVGTNNIGVGGMSAATTLSALQTYWSGAVADGFTVIATTVMPRGLALGLNASQEAQRKILNDSIRALTGSASFSYLLDFDHILQDPTSTILFQDGLHPTAGGHLMLAQSAGAVMGSSASAGIASQEPKSLTGLTAAIGGGSVAAGACVTGTASVPGVTTGGFVVSVTPASVYPGDGFEWSGYVSGADVVTVRVGNRTGGALTPTAAQYNVAALLVSTVALQELDTFTGTNATAITSHTSNYGHTWTTYNSISGDTSSPLTLNGSNGLVAASSISGTNYGEAYNSATPASADYTVSASIALPSPIVGGVVLYGRLNTAANTNYQVFIDPTTVSVYWVTGGSNGQIGTPYTHGLAAGTTHTLALQMTGTAIRALLDGALLATPGGTDSHIAAAGKGGVRITGPNLVVGNFEII